MSWSSVFGGSKSPEDLETDYQEQEFIEQYVGEPDIGFDQMEGEEDALEYVDTWIPYPSPSPIAPSSPPNIQQVVIGGGVPSIPHLPYPAAAELNHHFCELHPQECLEKKGGLQSRESACTTNCSVDGMDTGKSTLLSHVDLSGFGIALVVAILIFLGLHMGWDKEQKTGKSGSDQKREDGNGKRGTKKTEASDEQGGSQLTNPETGNQVKLVDSKTGKTVPAVNPETQEPVQLLNSKTKQPVPSVNPKTGEPTQLADPKTGAPIPLADPKTGRLVHYEDNTTGEPLQPGNPENTKNGKKSTKTEDKSGGQPNPLQNTNSQEPDSRSRSQGSDGGGNGGGSGETGKSKSKKDGDNNDSTSRERRSGKSSDGSDLKQRNEKDGKDGKNGNIAKDGRDGRDGRDGHSGKDGNGGKDGSNGRDGREANNGRDGSHGKDGKDGDGGRDGSNGKEGSKGGDGKTAPAQTEGNTSRSGEASRKKDTSDPASSRREDKEKERNENAKQAAESKRKNAEKEYDAATKGLEMAEQKAKKSARGADGTVPDVAPETPEVKAARDRMRNAQRALNSAQEKENELNGRQVTVPVGSDPTNKKTDKQRATSATQATVSTQPSTETEEPQTEAQKQANAYLTSAKNHLGKSEKAYSDAKKEGLAAGKSEKEVRNDPKVIKLRTERDEASKEVKRAEEKKKKADREALENPVAPAPGPAGAIDQDALEKQPEAQQKTPTGTLEQKAAQKRVNKARGAFDKAKNNENKEKSKAASDAKAKGLPYKPPPDTPAWKQKREELEVAKKELAEAVQQKKDADAKAASGNTLDPSAQPAVAGAPGDEAGSDGGSGDNQGPKTNFDEEEGYDSGGRNGSKGGGANRGKWGKWNIQPYMFWPMLILLPLIGLLSGGIGLIGSRGGGNIQVVSQRSGSGAVYSNPTSPAPNWVLESQPVEEQIVVNGGSGPQFTNPSDTTHLLALLLGVSLCGVPILWEFIMDDGSRIPAEPDPYSPIVHAIALGAIFILLVYKADRELGIATHYGPSAARYVQHVGAQIRPTVIQPIIPTIVETVETAGEALLEAEDLVFGDGRQLLGILASSAGGGALSHLLDPVEHYQAHGTSRADYTDKIKHGLVGMLPAVFGMLMGNAVT